MFLHSRRKSSAETLLAWTPKGLVGEYNVTATLTDLTSILESSHDFELTSRDAIGTAWLFDFLPHYSISAQVLDLPYHSAVALPHDVASWPERRWRVAHSSAAFKNLRALDNWIRLS